jgi:hypothetical protein
MISEAVGVGEMRTALLVVDREIADRLLDGAARERTLGSDVRFAPDWHDRSRGRSAIPFRDRRDPVRRSRAGGEENQGEDAGETHRYLVSAARIQ